MLNRVISLVLTLFLVGMMSILISMPFGYRPAGETFLTILVLLALVLLVRWLRQRNKYNPWNDKDVDDAASAFIAAESRKKG